MEVHVGKLAFVLGPLVIAYLASVLAVAYRLKRFHTETWQSLGSPTALHISPVNSLKLGFFSLFSSRYSVLKDRYLNGYIWAARALFFLLVLALFFQRELSRSFGFM